MQVHPFYNTLDVCTWSTEEITRMVYRKMHDLEFLQRALPDNV